MRASDFQRPLQGAVLKMGLDDPRVLAFRGCDIELRSGNEWFTLGLRASQGSGALLLRPWFGVTFHTELWCERSWSSASPIVASFTENEPEAHFLAANEAFRFLLSLNEFDLRQEVMNCSSSRDWLEVQAYSQVTLGDVEAPVRLLQEMTGKCQGLEDPEVRAQVERAQEVIQALESGGAHSAVSLLERWRQELKNSQSWAAFKSIID